ncbi:choline dehydrogenase-like flavoprotein [Novosphingobium sp. SG751A]|uniref:GMC family oxidoreductase n=1 Tax=Novosphingobium sp. SG751A TaxID=2587000 RepID=UPI001557BE91|nr:GMC family oxidoreductase [Novosphingobium sp. SG751A]NOW48236.1 choline dehydrogenase-like flavoprotein [Novosphingobium sp. SG751A]
MSEETHNFIDSFDYIVVGSGAGGGTLAARLAEGGARVLVLEAGSDPKNPPPGTGTTDWPFPKSDRLPDDYDVPTFHALSTENEAMKWDYYIRHFSDQATQERDDKFVARENGILYPRAGCLGGCTAHNAMITVYPHNADWDNIAQLTGDSTWRAGHMRRYFEKLEHCNQRAAPYRWLARIGINLTRHGWDGWLHTEKSLPVWDLLHDKRLVLTITIFVLKAFWLLPGKFIRFWWFLIARLDPNDWRLVRANAYGLHYPPLATRHHRRTSTRERLLDTQANYPDKLRIELNALVTRVLFDDHNRAIGVEYERGSRLYQAHANPNPDPAPRVKVAARREVILSGGAFNTPQMLQLSGIGPKEVLEEHGIKLRVDLPGVGRNLQDRYEVCVVNEMDFPAWKALEGATFTRDDPHYREWLNEAQGVYTGNGAVIAAIRRSLPERPLPDLFCFAVLAEFYGYFPGYSQLVVDHLNRMSWAVLKAHTNNRGGWVRIRSDNPRERPEINFRYFEEGTPGYEEDLASVVAGLRFVRELTKPLFRLGIAKRELRPGPEVETDEQLTDYARTQSWGHHASCTCAIGSDHDPNAVLDGNFRVRGVGGLRVVDASVFPRIPGFFIVSAIYMIAEKAADVILADFHADDPPIPEASWWEKVLRFCLFCRS